MNYQCVCVCVYVCVCVRACVCVSAPEAINYIHMMYNQLNKFVERNEAFYSRAWPLVKHVMTNQSNKAMLAP